MGSFSTDEELLTVSSLGVITSSSVLSPGTHTGLIVEGEGERPSSLGERKLLFLTVCIEADRPRFVALGLVGACFDDSGSDSLSASTLGERMTSVELSDFSTGEDSFSFDDSLPLSSLALLALSSAIRCKVGCALDFEFVSPSSNREFPDTAAENSESPDTLSSLTIPVPSATTAESLPFSPAVLGVSGAEGAADDRADVDWELKLCALCTPRGEVAARCSTAEMMSAGRGSESFLNVLRRTVMAGAGADDTCSSLGADVCR